MILASIGAPLEETRRWLAALGAERSAMARRDEGVVLAHTGAASESAAQVGEVLVVADARLAPHGAACDAEAIARAYEAHGASCVTRLTGTFAFVLFDARRRRFLASSALTSRRPLAYWRRGQVVVVGSKALSLLRHPGAAPPALDEGYLAHALLGYGGARPGTTAIGGIRRLPAGVALTGASDALAERTLDALAVGGARGGDARDAVRAALAGSVGRALEAHARPCVSLSGGVDSPAVAVLAARRAPGSAAFSMVADGAPDEARFVDALVPALPGMRIHRVDCSGAREYPDLDPLPLRDDPVLKPLSLLPARLVLWRAVRREGYGALLDGEGADELFDTFVGPLDALRRGDWLAVARHLGARESPLSRAFRALVLPHLPDEVRRVWTARWARPGRHLPPFLARSARARAGVRDATDAFFARWIARPSIDVASEWLSSPTELGAAAAHRELAAALGVELVSPFVDRDVIELVLGLPPSEVLSRGETKPLLRAALAGVVPDVVRTRAKDVGLSLALGASILASPRARRAVADPRARERFDEWIRFDALEEQLARIERGWQPSEWEQWQLECAVTLLEWYARAAREHGVA